VPWCGWGEGWQALQVFDYKAPRASDNGLKIRVSVVRFRPWPPINQCFPCADQPPSGPRQPKRNRALEADSSTRPSSASAASAFPRSGGVRSGDETANGGAHRPAQIRQLVAGLSALMVYAAETPHLRSHPERSRSRRGGLLLALLSYAPTRVARLRVHHHGPEVRIVKSLSIGTLLLGGPAG